MSWYDKLLWPFSKPKPENDPYNIPTEYIFTYLKPGMTHDQIISILNNMFGDKEFRTSNNKIITDIIYKILEKKND